MMLSPALTKALLKQPQHIQKFAELYLQNAPKAALEETSAATLVAHVKDAYSFFALQSASPIQIRVYTPAWSANTVVETLIPDQPFLIDTLWMALQRENHQVHYTLHPVLNVTRTKEGKVKEFGKTGSGRSESFIHVEIAHTAQPERLRKALEEALTYAIQAVQDYPAMLNKMQELTATAAANMPNRPENLEHLAFLNWLTRGNYIFLGYRSYKISWKGKDAQVGLHKGASLGVLQDETKSSVYKPVALSSLRHNLQWHYTTPHLLTLTKSFTKSMVHRAVEMDYVGIKEFDKTGKVVGEHRFLGLLSSQAYATHTRQVPLINRKIDETLKLLEVDQHSYRYRALKHILESYPKDELLQINVADAARLAEGILELQEQPQVKLITYQPDHERVISTLVFLPQDRMNSARRMSIQKALMAAFQGEDMEWQVELGKGTLTRIFTKIRLASSQLPPVNFKKLEKQIIALTQNWEDSLKSALETACGKKQAEQLLQTYAHAFPGNYMANTSADMAVDDIHALEQLRKSDSPFLATIPSMEKSAFILKIFHKESQIDLSSIMPMFESLGLHITTENPSQIQSSSGPIWLHDFHVQLQASQTMDQHVAEVLIQAIGAIQRGEMELDCLNNLVMQGLNLEQILLLRAYSAYMHQTGRRYAKEYVRSTLVKHANLARSLTHLFDARLNPALPATQAKQQEEESHARIKAGLNAVTVLDEDRIIQRFYDVLMATKRTNFWKRTDSTAPLSFKIASRDIPDLVKPTPLYEIFVYHHTMEGLHLRGGMVARGGLRHSDRHSDYRTEILGLMKAQMVKNAIIVPTGSKGGFVVKEPLPQDRQAYTATVTKAYTLFIQSLLCLTDNLHAGKVVPPRKVKRIDGDDPYLVVAADKGTATFSDVANNVAQTADFWPNITGGFWLGDAFASGGSNGYDHKKMAITARGAWECVKHHFLNLGKDIQTEPFTVVGIGDMAGDVFGNGMLLSKQIQLVGAFNHLHIFVDPTPDAAKSFAERQRLFNTPGSSWTDYNKKLISKGGGVFERSAKAIPLSAEMQKILGTTAKSLAPNDLIHHLLKADVDLLWNGGIGTYVKASQEDHLKVGDRANDETRVNGNEVRAKVIGEGGNLGCTQLGRVEYAQKGGLINTDALDNSAGVDCSDHEVNIKILTTLAIEKSKLAAKSRNALLESMTDEVAELVLQDNYLQALAITLAERQGAGGTEAFLQLIKTLQQAGKLDPVVENLPDEETLTSRGKNALTRPELCTLIAYAKYALYDDLVNSTLVQKGLADDYAQAYFPQKMQAKFAGLIPAHQLRAEIVATTLAGEVVNRMGISFCTQLQQETNCSGEEIARAFLFAKQVFGADSLWKAVAELDTKVPAGVQMELYESLHKLMEQAIVWALGNLPRPLNVAQEVARFAPLVQKDLKPILEKQLPASAKGYFKLFEEGWKHRGLAAPVANQFSLLPAQIYALEIVRVAFESKLSVAAIAPVYFEIGQHFGLDVLRNRVATIPTENNWQRLASVAATNQLFATQRRLVNVVVKAHPEGGKKSADLWLSQQAPAFEKYHLMWEKAKRTEQATHAMISVILDQLETL